MKRGLRVLGTVLSGRGVSGAASEASFWSSRGRSVFNMTSPVSDSVLAAGTGHMTPKAAINVAYIQ